MKESKLSVLSKNGVMQFAAAICCLLWGSAFPAIKIGYNLFNINSSDTPSIILFAGVRFTLAGALTLLIFSIAQRKFLIPAKADIPKIAVLSVFQTVVQYFAFYLGLASTDGSKASVINGTSVFFAIIISCFIFKQEKINLTKIIGCVIGFAGIVLINIPTGATVKSNVGGELLIVLSSVSYAFSSVFMRKYSAGSNPAMLSGYQFILGGIVLTVAGAVFGGKLNPENLKAVAILVYLAFLSAVAYSLWSLLLKYNDVSRVAVCGFMIPVFGFFLSMLLLKENTSGWIGGVASLILVALGMIIVNKPKGSKSI